MMRASLLLCVAAVGAALRYPPLTASAWTHALDGAPVLSASEPWEKSCVCENVAMIDKGRWVMWYRGGWGEQAVGIAHSDDGIHWTKGNNAQPVLGHGGSGVMQQNICAQPWVIRVNETHLRMFTTSHNSTYSSQGSLVWSSEDGLHWSRVAGTDVPKPKMAGKMGHFGNRVVWRDTHASPTSPPWRMYQELMVNGVWAIFLLKSDDGLRWSYIQDTPLSSLDVGGMYGGPRILHSNGKAVPYYEGNYHVFYHATNRSHSDLPTDIYHAQSPDLRNWKVTPHTPLVSHRGPPTWEHDQVAGPVPLVVNGTAFIFYDGDNNVDGHCAIGAVTATQEW